MQLCEGIGGIFWNDIVAGVYEWRSSVCLYFSSLIERRRASHVVVPCVSHSLVWVELDIGRSNIAHLAMSAVWLTALAVTLPPARSLIVRAQPSALAQTRARAHGTVAERFGTHMGAPAPLGRLDRLPSGSCRASVVLVLASCILDV